MNKLNNKGLTLFELLATIVVASVVSIILMQVLALTVKARTQMEVENKLQNESYIIAENIRNNILQLEAQQIEIIEDSNTQTIIRVSHLYDYTTDNDGNIVEDTSNPVTHDIILHKQNKTISYNGDILNSNNMEILSDSKVELIAIDDNTCDFSVAPCDEGIIKLTLVIQILLSDGTELVSKEFITTILV